MDTMETKTGNKTWMGLARQNMTRAAMLLVMMLTCLAAGANTVTLTSSTGQVTLNNGDVVTGTGGSNTYLVISSGATVTLSGVDITNYNLDYDNEIPTGIACQGDATIILAKGTTNTIIGCYYLDPCIKVGPPNTTLTIKGYGTLFLRSWGWGACIGSRNQQACGNIVIEGGTLDLKTSIENLSGYAACIGSSGNGGSCGDITISGGNIRATASFGAAPIGSGASANSGTATMAPVSTCGNINITGGTIYAYLPLSSGGAAAIGGGYDSHCGNISISGITSVSAVNGSMHAPYCIGPSAGDNSTCGTLTLWGQTSGYIVRPNYGTVVLAPTDIPYTVRFDANDGTGSMSDQDFYSNTPQALRANTFTFDGKYFSHWSTLANGDGYDYTDGEVVNNLGNVTLYAQWHDPYTVHFDANGGTGTMNDQQITSYGLALTANAFTRDDYIFIGWNTKADGTGTSYADGEAVKDLGNTTLYAQWLVNYTVSFDANGGTGTMNDQRFNWNTQHALPASTFILDGYDFAGWNTKADGSGTNYSDGQTVDNLGDITLYAQWTPANYSIGYILDGGTNASSNPTSYTIESETFTIAAPTRLGYDFVGWTYEGQSTPIKRLTIARGSTGDKTFVANWALASIVRLTQDAGYWELQNGQTLTGTGGPDTHITIAAGATVTLSGADITTIAGDNHHYWAGLSCVGDATIILADGTTNHVRGVYGSPGIYVPAGKTLTIRGGGTLNAYGGGAGIGSPTEGSCGNIVLDGGIINAAGGYEAANIGSAVRGVCGDITITTGVTSVSVSESTRSASIGSGRWGSCGTVNIGGVVTGSIYGNFTYRPADYPLYTITFNAKEGTGDMAAQRVLGNMSFDLNDCTFTREEYVFTGWNTKANGTGTAYANGQGITATGDMTLYAQWDHRDIYNVTFDANGGTGSMDGQVFRKYDPSQNLSACTFTREGYIFIGWNTRANGTGTAYTDEQNITVTGDMTLYAQWREIFTVNFHANGGTGTMDSQTFVEGVPQSISSCTFTAPAGYVFVGWNTESDGSGTAYTDEQDITATGGMALYAQWREGSIVTFDANGGTGTMANQVFGKNTRQALNVNTFTLDGYFFVAWNTKADGSGMAYADKASVAITADMTLYAQWSVRSDRTINLKFMLDNSVTLGDGDMLTGSANLNYQVTIADGATVIFNNLSLIQYESIPCIICEGDATIVLSGHNHIEGKDGAGIYIPAGKTLTIRGTGSLTAKCYMQCAGIGGTSSPDYPQSCGNIIITSEVAYVTAETTRGNYCIGPAELIASANNCGTVIIGGVETGPIKQNSFTYTNITYAITFDANGGLGTMAEQTFRLGTPQNLSACTMIREGYIFIGWNTAANGSGTAYTDEQSITATGDMTLYAQWRRPFTVTFDPNGSAGTMENQVFYEGFSQNLNTCTFTAPLGFNFAGWNTSRDGSGSAYTDGQAITITDNLTLYAQWVMPVWVNNNRLNWANRYDILGDGTMSFDPLTNTLTLDHPTQNVAIRSEGIDLTVKGIYKMTAEAGDVALDVAGGTLTLEGDFTLRGSTTGINVGGDVTVKGTVRAYGGTNAIIHTGEMTLVPGFISTTMLEEYENDELKQTKTKPGTASGNGTAASPFQINSSDDWTKACADVANNCETAGLYFVLNSSITATAMMGKPDNPFAGVIDGQRHFFKVIASINKDVEGAALFRTVSGATIKNLYVEGSV
ncbi:MAG: InlB B-repeat-containing protein, partial [Bacteroidaceae bacterium]|nr:InlB B-repeat-containing protein [Bacteroidaceae bacterium]